MPGYEPEASVRPNGSLRSLDGIEAPARRTPRTARGALQPPRDRVAGLPIDSLHDTIDADAARQLASVMIATVDRLLIRTFIDADSAPTSHDLATAAGRMVAPELGRQAP